MIAFFVCLCASCCVCFVAVCCFFCWGGNCFRSCGVINVCVTCLRCVVCRFHGSFASALLCCAHVQVCLFLFVVA